MSSHEKLAAASNDRKARLAQLKSLKRKQAPTDNDDETSTALTTTSTAQEGPSTSTELARKSEEPVTKAYLSGRNYDPETRNVKLGFDSAPIGDEKSTLEYKAGQLALETKKAQEEEKKEDKPLDLFKLQPKKPNWDLKRDLEEKLKVVDVWTENAIARMVRERVEGQKKAAEIKNGKEGDAEEVGMQGEELVEVMHLKEREEEEARKREVEEEDAS